jgi:hypothetical protein
MVKINSTGFMSRTEPESQTSVTSFHVGIRPIILAEYEDNEQDSDGIEWTDKDIETEELMAFMYPEVYDMFALQVFVHHTVNCVTNQIISDI